MVGVLDHGRLDQKVSQMLFNHMAIMSALMYALPRLSKLVDDHIDGVDQGEDITSLLTQRILESKSVLTGNSGEIVVKKSEN